MKWFKHNSDSSHQLKINGLKFKIISGIYILIIFLIPLVWLNCDKELKELVTPNEADFPAAPLDVKAIVADRSIVISWQMGDVTDIHCYNIYRKDAADAKMDLLDSSFIMKYVDNNVINGTIYYYQVVAVNERGYEGKRSTEVTARPNMFDLIIANGLDYINLRAVTLNLIAPVGTPYMILGHDSLFTNSSWENYASARNWTLTQGDGVKYVYAKFRDSDGNENKSPIRDSIILDTQAVISEVRENTNNKVIQPGDNIYFRLVAGEPDGKATIDIGTEKMGIILFDDGTHGDSLRNDGKYELNYQTPSNLEVVNATITGHFTDRANNMANDITAKTRITIQRAPAAVRLYLQPISGATSKTLELIWSQNQDTDFASYRLFRSTKAGVDTSSLLLSLIASQTTISYQDSALDEGVNYYYRLFVYDNSGLSTGSNEVMGGINSNEPPVPVTLYLITPLVNSTTALNLSWSKNTEADFSSYRIFRSKSAGVDSTDWLVTNITDQSVTTYDDTTLQQDTEYYYRVYVYDTGGLAARSNEQKGKTNANEKPRAVLLYKPAPIANSTTSLNLGWSKNTDSDFASYKIYRSKTVGVTNITSSLDTTILDQNMTNYNDLGLQENTEYHYRVYVYDTGGLFAASNEDSGTTNANEVPIPVTLLKPIVVDSTTLRLIWTQNNETDFKMYAVYRSKSSPVNITGTPITIIYDNMATDFIDAGLTKNVTYYYRVVVTDQGGKSSGSNEESGTPHP